MSEEFRVHPVLPMIRVSTLGRVQRMKTPGRKSLDPEKYVWVDAAVERYPSGYCYARIWINQRSFNKYVHHLVLETFVGPRPIGCEARHVNDDDKSNNCLDNLAWGTPKQNAADKKRHGTSNEGSKHGMAKLTEADVERMRAMRRSGVCRDDIAAAFGVATTHVSKVIAGKMWGHVRLEESERAELKRLGIVRGDKHHKTKIKAADRKEMARLREIGMRVNDIASKYGVHRSLVSRILKAERISKGSPPG